MLRTALPLLALLALLLLPLVHADEPDTAIIDETWLCYSIHDHNKRTPLITLERYKALSAVFGLGEDGGAPTMGKVIAAGQTNVGYFSIAGLNRRWDWGASLDDRLVYAFVLQPDGSGAYYDFSTVEDGGTTKASQFFDCVMKKKKKR